MFGSATGLIEINRSIDRLIKFIVKGKTDMYVHKVTRRKIRICRFHAQKGILRPRSSWNRIRRVLLYSSITDSISMIIRA